MGNSTDNENELPDKAGKNTQIMSKTRHYINQHEWKERNFSLVRIA